MLYIGPETRPEPPRRNASRCRSYVRPTSSGTQAPKVRKPLFRPRPPQPRPATPVSRPPLPEPPQPLIPSGRVRVAELAGSMLLAAPLAGLATILSVLGFDVAGQSHPQDPGQLALLFGTTLMGTWGVLGASKYWEEKSVSGFTKRMGLFGLGGALGLLSGFLAEWAFLGYPPGWSTSQLPNSSMVVGMTPLSAPGALPVNLAFFFAFTFGAQRLWKLSARDRSRRFRFWPVLAAAGVAALVGVFVPSPQVWGLFTVAIIAVLVQLVSPWSPEATAYRQYEEARERGRAG